MITESEVVTAPLEHLAIGRREINRDEHVAGSLREMRKSGRPRWRWDPAALSGLSTRLGSLTSRRHCRRRPRNGDATRPLCFGFRELSAAPADKRHNFHFPAALIEPPTQVIGLHSSSGSHRRRARETRPSTACAVINYNSVARSKTVDPVDTLRLISSSERNYGREPSYRISQRLTFQWSNVELPREIITVPVTLYNI